MSLSFLQTVPLLAALALTACGGGGSDSAPVTPVEPEVPQPAKPTPLKLELLTGVTTVNLENCSDVVLQMDMDSSSKVPVSSMQFTRLLRATVYQDAIYFAETGQGCKIIIDEEARRPFRYGLETRRLLELKNDSFRRLDIGPGASVTIGPPANSVRYPSGYIRAENRQLSFVLSYVAANSDNDFALDVDWVAINSQENHLGWRWFAPGFFYFLEKLSVEFPYYPGPYFQGMVAGRSGELPALIDGKGKEAGFVAPHDLEADAQGLLYLIDDGHIRTIDDNYNVKTLDSAALGITAKIKALDGDHQGRIHALTKQAQGQYTWHRLADGSSVNFTVPSPVEGNTLTAETFTIMDDEMLMSVRESTPYSPSRIFHVSATGEVTAMTGTQTATTEQDFLDNSAQYLLPAIQHIEYGVDGHLYVVLPQGVLIARAYKITAQ